MSNKFLRMIGGLLVVLGLCVIGFAAYQYIDSTRTEQALETEVPGQEAQAHPTEGSNKIAKPNQPPLASLPDATLTTASDSSAESSGESPVTAPEATVIPTEATVIPTSVSVSKQPQADPSVKKQAASTSVPEANAKPNPTTAPATSPNTSNSARLGAPRGQGSMAIRLQIAKLNLDLPIQEATFQTTEQNGVMVSDWDVPFAAAGHLSTTVQPGEIGNAVLSGHHNLIGPNKFGVGAFAGMWNLVAGDEIDVKTNDGNTQVWRVQQSYPLKEGGEPYSVRVQHAQQVLADTNEPRLTLLTCWNGKDKPLSGNTYRWVVVASLASTN